MRVIVNARHAGHVPKNEFDNGALCPAWDVPGRVEAIRTALERRPGFAFEDAPPLPDDVRVPLHDAAYVSYLRETSAALKPNDAVYPSVFPFRTTAQPLGPKALRGAYGFDTYTPILAGTFAAALGSVSAALRGAELIASGEPSAYVLTRPPGHHAEHARYGGYSYLNSAAIAADHLAQRGSVAVLDLDVHHGNGTQHLFYDRADVLAVSIHGDPTVLFPFFSGFADETGTGAGLGFNHNLPLPHGSGVRNYRPAVKAALEIIGSFKPAFLVVSFGTDTHEADPIGGFRLPTEEYAKLGGAVKQLGLPTLIVQEGGYNCTTIGDCVAGFLEGQ